MNTFTFFALLICAIVAMVGAVANPMAPAPMQAESEVDSAQAIPGDDVLMGAESRGYGRGRGHYYGRGHGYHHHGH